MTYLEEKRQFLEARAKFIKSAKEHFGNDFKKEIDKFVKDTDAHIENLDKQVRPGIFSLATNILQSFQYNFDSKQEMNISIVKSALPSIFESISRSLDTLHQAKNQGRSH
jgi:hypothetical protein